MSNSNLALGSAIFTYTQANPIVYSGSTIAYYRDLAPTSTEPPYITYQPISGVDEYTFNTSEIDYVYQFKVISNRNNSTEANNIYALVHASIQNANIVPSGFKLLRCKRRSTISFREPDGFWNVGGQYKIDLVEN